MGEVAAFAHVLTHKGILTAIAEQVRFARARGCLTNTNATKDGLEALHLMVHLVIHLVGRSAPHDSSRAYFSQAVGRQPRAHSPRPRHG
jgi:hypothetical protein